MTEYKDIYDSIENAIFLFNASLNLPEELTFNILSYTYVNKRINVFPHTDKSVSFTLYHDDIEVMLLLRGEVVMPNVSGLRPIGVALQNR